TAGRFSAAGHSARGDASIHCRACSAACCSFLSPGVPAGFASRSRRARTSAPSCGSASCRNNYAGDTASCGCGPLKRNPGRHPSQDKKAEETPLRTLRLLRLSALPRPALLLLAPAVLVAVAAAALSRRTPAAARVLLPPNLALVTGTICGSLPI